MPVVCNAQKLGQVSCSKQDGYVYLYNSMTTLEIRATLKCGQQVQVLDRSDNFVHVMTDKGEDAIMVCRCELSVVRGETAPAAKSTVARGKQKQSASAAHSDASARGGASAAPAPPREIVLARQTPVHLEA